MTTYCQLPIQSSLLLYGLALQAIHNLQGAVPFAPVDTVGQLATVCAVGSHRRHQADVGPHQAVEHGQLGGDPFHALAHRHLHATDITAARVTCGM